MRRLYLLTVGLLVALWLSAGATAEKLIEPDYPIDPNRETAMAYYDMLWEDPSGDPGRFAAGTCLTVTLALASGDYATDTTWNATASGGDGSYEYLFQLIREDSAFNNDHELVISREYSTDSTFVGSVVASGSYELQVWVRDGEGSTGYAKYAFDFTDPNFPTIDARVAEIVEACTQDGCETDFDKVLWLHDWLTHNARYDYTYSYYGSDGVLLRGTGVCDSYAKASLKLLRAAGVTCEYAMGNTPGGSHAWDIVQMDGEWYWVDATWDDPGDSETAVSDKECHTYMGLTDEIFSRDHTCTNAADDGRPCQSLVDNYFIHTGKIYDLWTSPLVSEIEGCLRENFYTREFTPPDRYAYEPNPEYVTYGEEHIVYSLAAYALNSDWTWDADGMTTAMNVEYDMDANLMRYIMRFDDRTLILPPNVLEVQDGSFEGLSEAMAVELGESVQTIGPGAFGNCSNLWRVSVPNPATEIDPTAFENSEHVSLAGPAGGSAEDFAGNYGLHFVEE